MDENQEISLKLSPTSEIWFDEFKNIWKSANDPSVVRDRLYHHLEENENPYEEILKLMYNSPDFSCAKSKSMAFTIMKYFQEWATESADRFENLLGFDIKMFAFNVVTVPSQKELELIRLVADIYKMEADGETLLNTLVQDKRYEEACKLCTVVRVDINFDIYTFLVPLILQTAPKIIFCTERFLKSNSECQRKLVSFMDEMVGKRANFKSALGKCAEQYGIPNDKWEKWTEKLWESSMDKLVKTFKLPHDITPFLNLKRKESALAYVLKLKYVEIDGKSIDYETWRGRVIGAVKDDNHLQNKLIRDIVRKYKDPAEALKWARYYNIPKENWPESVQDVDNNPSNIRQEESADSSDDADFHKLSTGIIAINDVDGFRNFLDQVQTVDLVGVDCEWNSVTSKRETSKLAILQIATRDSVYVFNAITLANETELWQELTNLVFNNLNILKLGFDFKSDKSIRLPQGLSFQKCVRFLDLQSLWKKIQAVPEVVFPYIVKDTGLSLSALVNLCLGKPLNKSYRLSNWEIWPLPQQHLEYAALDAYCLIEAYDVLQKYCKEANFLFEETCEKLMNIPKHQQANPK